MDEEGEKIYPERISIIRDGEWTEEYSSSTSSVDREEEKRSRKD